MEMAVNPRWSGEGARFYHKFLSANLGQDQSLMTLE